MVLSKNPYDVDKNWWYVKNMKPIRWVHELQAIFRVHHIDQAIGDGLLFFDKAIGNPNIFE